MKSRLLHAYSCTCIRNDYCFEYDFWGQQLPCLISLVDADFTMFDSARVDRSHIGHGGDLEVCPARQEHCKQH